MPRTTDKDAMQARILDAALGCFRTRGYHAARMSDVAAAAGLAKGTLYLYFSSKEELTAALLERYFGSIEAELAAQPAPRDLWEFLEGVRRALSPDAAQLETTLLLFDVMGPGFALPAGREIIGRFVARLADSYAAQLAALQAAGEIWEGADCDATAAALASMADGLVIHLALFGRDRAAYAPKRDAALALIGRGLRP